ncbi:MAG: type II toxin-antitoxin system HicB family antitoxin [Candidatus Deferrimicrobium sp.]
MKDMMTHRGYYGSVSYDDEDRIFYGKIEFIRALVSYEGTDVTSLREAFEEAVEDYFEMCRAHGEEPEKPLKGSFNVRIGPELHRKLALAAVRKRVSLNKYIAEILKKSA